MKPTRPPPAPAGPPSWATTVVIPTTWTPAQALAVFELLDDLRETVATLCLDQIQAQLRQEQCGGGDTATAADAHNQAGDDRTFSTARSPTNPSRRPPPAPRQASLAAAGAAQPNADGGCAHPQDEVRLSPRSPSRPFPGGKTATTGEHRINRPVKLIGQNAAPFIRGF